MNRNEMDFGGRAPRGDTGWRTTPMAANYPIPYRSVTIYKYTPNSATIPTCLVVP